MKVKSRGENRGLY